MKTFFKRLLLTLLVVLLILIATPFLFLQFGSESSATSAKMLLNAIAGYGIESPPAEVVEQRYKVPEGFSVSVYAASLGKIRFMHMTQQGDLIVSRPRSGDVLLLERDRDGDGYPDGQRTLLEGLVKPHGLDIADGWLYIAESTALGRVSFDEQDGQLTGEYQRIVEGLMDTGNHWTKTVGVGPDGWLYFTSGSTCNVCEEEDPQRATMMRVKLDGSELSIYATGLRNSVGFDWAPWDQSLYATDNGRDLLGDDFPPCELNKIERGGFYGWPYINGFSELDPDFGVGKDNLLSTSISPAHGFKAHNAPLGIRFLRHNVAPGFEKTALAALHGSWNRSERDGYKVVSLHWQEDGSIVEKDFLTGFLGKADVTGRPADVTESSDGSIYISDDYSGTIFRVVYGEQVKSSPAKIAAPVTVTIDPEQALAIYSDEQRQSLQQQGERLYQQYGCGNCHDPERATPMRPVRPLKDLAQRYTVTEIADFFLAPTPPMPVFPLNEQQREALSVYLYPR
ncbi:MAG: PQQ-dependent sugar dehydrogenase [Oceanicoccus sp.]|uniref:PQQ-dependent sugar dehydrogenase n=1 Tax=Oceanicoccus sp. TaxID=2691044 RepID=UPI00261CB469|nr:PQQ-dependent sugar dehydrogenase [Oceanicoccus sp.]MDG1772778.1 PQQ-dependent sugar dehydrogenase [Oceanicoccus sp.]